MPRKITDADINNFIKLRTESNMTCQEISDVVGFSKACVYNRLVAAGVDTSNRRHYEIGAADAEKILIAYDDGVGCNGIARHLGIKASDAKVVELVTKHRGKPRNRSEQQFARMARSTPEQVAHLVSAANKASRGAKAPIERKIKRAKALEGRFNKRSTYEPIVFNMIKDTFPDAIPSKAIDIYNVDIGVGNVAVEVFGGGWAVSDARRVSHYIDRTIKLGKGGLNFVFVICQKGIIPDAKKIIATINELSVNPSSASEYRVIWSDTDGAAGLCSDFNDLAFVCPFVNIRDVATGRYKRVAR